MKILAFDSSSQALSVAILEDEQLMAESTIAIKKNHSISLMPTIDFLMKSVNLEPSDLDRIAVAQGPGSYTGLRVAVATAKTLAYALNIDLVGISSLYALTDIEAEGLIVPLIDARRNNVYVGFYDNGKSVSPDRHASFESVLEEVRGESQVTFVGEVTNFVEQIKEQLPKANIQMTLPSAFLIGKAAVFENVTDVDAFVPNYLKRVEAEENWLKDHVESDPKSYIKRV